MDISKNNMLQKQCLSKPDYSVQKERMLHPAVQIYIWICLTLAVQMLGGFALTLVAGILTALAFSIGPARLFCLLRRTRWILFSVFLIYAYTSPGDALWPQLGAFSPVTDGILDGFLQLLRLCTVLAGLSILLALLPQSQLIAGLYTLFRPVCFFGMSRERVAVRLALTLRYAESAMQDTASHWRGSIENLLVPMPVAPGMLELQLPHFARRDWLLVAATSAVLLGICLPGGVWR